MFSGQFGLRSVMIPSIPAWVARPPGLGLWLSSLTNEVLARLSHVGFCRSHEPSYSRMFLKHRAIDSAIDTAIRSGKE